MKRIPALGTFLLISLGLAPEETISYTPEDGAVLHRTFEARAKFALEGMDILVDGEVARSLDEVPDVGSEFVERIVVTDRVGGVAGGRPTTLERTFDELSQETQEHVGDEKHESSESSDLIGGRVTFRWDGDQHAYVAEKGKDQHFDGDLLDRLVEDMDLRKILPEGEVEKGDEWDIPVEAYLYWMWPGGHLAFHGEDADSSGANDFYDQVVEHLEGTGRARFLEVRTEDDREVAVVRVEFEISTSYESDTEGSEEAPAIHFKSAVERSVQGEVLWDLAAGRLHSAHLEADAKRVESRSWTAENEDGNPVEVERRDRHSGTYTYDATVELGG